MRKREIKKTLIRYEETQDAPKSRQRSRQKSREKKQNIEVVDATSRRARIALLKSRRNQQEQIKATTSQSQIQPAISFSSNLVKTQTEPYRTHTEQRSSAPNTAEPRPEAKDENEKNDMDDEVENEERRILLKPVYIPKEDRSQEQMLTKEKQQQRKKKALRYTTKLLLLENAKEKYESDEEIVHSSDDQKDGTMPDDDDGKNEEYEYQLWKVRELKRIRRDRDQRRKIEMQRAEIERRRKMNNEEILLENKVMGSDATENPNQTKYVYMQKYYHKGAFYQDSQDPIFKRDYNLPTPLQMQDKSMLPEILQRRQGNFGKKGQSKYKHLTAEDTTNFDPQFRADESILASWKKKMAGYKGSRGSNI